MSCEMTDSCKVEMIQSPFRQQAWQQDVEAVREVSASFPLLLTGQRQLQVTQH